MLTKTFVCYYSLRTCGWWNKEAVAKISVQSKAVIIKALDSVRNKKFQVYNFKFLFCQTVMIEKLPILGINVDFVTAVFLRKARPCLPTVLCAYFLFKRGAKKERWVNFRFGSCTFLQSWLKCDVASDRLNCYFSLIQRYFCIFIRNCKRSDHY